MININTRQRLARTIWLVVICLFGGLTSTQLSSCKNKEAVVEKDAAAVATTDRTESDDADSKTGPRDESSPYGGFEKTIMKYLNTDTIPSSFPEWKEGMTRDAYREQALEWGKTHQDLVDPEWIRTYEKKKMLEQESD
jgi:hypothetical protein